MQYHEYKKEIDVITNSGGGGDLSQSKSKTNIPSDETANKAIRLEPLVKKCKLIEKTLLDVTQDYQTLYDALFFNITNQMSFDQSDACGYIKEYGKNKRHCRNKFYELRRKFYYLLSLRKEI